MASTRIIRSPNPRSPYTIGKPTTTSTSTSTPTPQPTFTSPTFDPADYLNDALPPLTLAATQPNASRAPGSVPLADLSTQVQSLVSAVNAQNVRHSASLTQVTDEILRGGGRLAYEVEVLRGETIGLADMLGEGLRGDIGRFVPEGGLGRNDGDGDGEDDMDVKAEDGEEGEEKKNDPDYISKLRTLNQVRSRLDEVVHTFGDAMEWPLPPSELSLTSSFISVSAPDPSPEAHSLEQKGQETMQKLRAEVTDLLDSNGGGQAGLDAASRRVDAIRLLANVWKGTAEEKARNRFVDGLARIVEDRRRVLESSLGGGSGVGAVEGGPAQQQQQRGHQRQVSEGPGGGIFKNLQRLREEIYLE